MNWFLSKEVEREEKKKQTVIKKAEPLWHRLQNIPEASVAQFTPTKEGHSCTATTLFI
jgi:hypothetical protein